MPNRILDVYLEVSLIPQPIDSASWIKQYLGVKVVVITKGNESVVAPAADEYVTGDAYNPPLLLFV